MATTVFTHPHSPRLQRRAVRMALITALITGGLCLIVLLRFEHGPLAFATIGTYFSAGDPDGTTGYDGQFFYFIARDGADSTPYLDGPTLRLQRIVYPVFARLMALGNAELVPWALVLINVAAQSIGAGLLAYISGRFGGPTVAGLIYGLWIGGQYAVRLDLSEPLCLALALGALLAYCQGRLRWAVLLLVLAALTKELAFALAAGIALHALTQRRLGWASLLMGAPALAFGMWWAILYAWFGTLPTIYPAAQGIRLIPYNGLFREDSAAEFVLLVIWIALPSAMIFVAALVTAVRSRRLTLGACLAVTCVGFVMFMPGVSWEDQLAAYRVAVPWLVGAVVFLAQHQRRLIYWLTGLTLTALIFVPLSPLWFG